MSQSTELRLINIRSLHFDHMEIIVTQIKNHFRTVFNQRRHPLSEKITDQFDHEKQIAGKLEELARRSGYLCETLLLSTLQRQQICFEFVRLKHAELCDNTGNQGSRSDVERWIPNLNT